MALSRQSGQLYLCCLLLSAIQGFFTPVLADDAVVSGQNERGFEEIGRLKSEEIKTFSCDPCRLTISRRSQPISIRFKVSGMPYGEKIIKYLEVAREDMPKWSQSLTVHMKYPVFEDEEFIIGTDDINGDGYNDLYFVTGHGIVNYYADYWLFNPLKQRFDYIGNYPVLNVKPKTKTLSTYERGGAAGMIYTEKHYRFINNKLTLIYKETQDQTNKFGIFVKKIYELKKGKMRLVKKEVIKEDLPDEEK